LPENTDEAIVGRSLVFHFDRDGNRKRALSKGKAEIRGRGLGCLFRQLRQPSRFLQARLSDYLQPTLHECL
jgi:hypothetical protein